MQKQEKYKSKNVDSVFYYVENKSVNKDQVNANMNTSVRGDSRSPSSSHVNSQDRVMVEQLLDSPRQVIDLSRDGRANVRSDSPNYAPFEDTRTSSSSSNGPQRSEPIASAITGNNPNTNNASASSTSSDRSQRREPNNNSTPPVEGPSTREGNGPINPSKRNDDNSSGRFHSDRPTKMSKGEKE